MSQNPGYHNILQVDVDGEVYIKVDQEAPIDNGMERVIRLYDEQGTTITTIQITCSASRVEVK